MSAPLAYGLHLRRLREAEQAGTITGDTRQRDGVLYGQGWVARTGMGTSRKPEMGQNSRPVSMLHKLSPIYRFASAIAIRVVDVEMANPSPPNPPLTAEQSHASQFTETPLFSNQQATSRLWLIMFARFISGLQGLVTPCCSLVRLEG